MVRSFYGRGLRGTRVGANFVLVMEADLERTGRARRGKSHREPIANPERRAEIADEIAALLRAVAKGKPKDSDDFSGKRPL